MRICVSFSLLCTIVFVFAQERKSRGKVCITPTENVRRCIPLNSCPSLVRMAQEDQVKFNGFKSACANNASTNYVCCDDNVPRYSDYPSPNVETTTLRTTTTTSVSTGVRALNGLENGDACTTPNNLKGRCVNLIQCDPLVQLLRQRPVPESVKTFAQQSRCGNSRPIVVCCPTEEPREVNSNGIFLQSPLLPKDTECGLHHADRHIFGGKATDIDEFPWLALIEYKMQNEPRGELGCGGALISQRYVLTAAHCLSEEAFDSLGRRLSVRLGEYDTNQDVDCLPRRGCAPPIQNIPVQKYTLHPRFDINRFSDGDDIALIRLSRNAQFSNFVRPICLPNRGVEIVWQNREHLWVAGWGRTERGDYSNIKLKVKIPRLPLSTCQRELTNLAINPQTFRLRESKQMCAGGQDNKDACTGDSGGPLMALYTDPDTDNVFWFNAGIVSFGSNQCGTVGKPSVYTRVNQYTSWILQNLEP